ncbi:hypothetical protein CONPUDRAFT_166557 [Coniophora puteana RWD-64-598 SS2]|uniref:Uncharacterized protein n=1 Tax=Coniophora puteana (strain RWD-64-598) TaxID=741705 RepID=A0A5M3MKW6_CONPW|nr:uncharacterized protein CONPUDRAFT_166557 [Coniophora puteana RWD-64-598 SS2]EIW79872.1 hypothetical protein CONPUDRAFT_166557 [Coniophora puteana RWD-64-598 SS2]
MSIASCPLSRRALIAVDIPARPRSSRHYYRQSSCKVLLQEDAAGSSLACHPAKAAQDAAGSSATCHPAKTSSCKRTPPTLRPPVILQKWYVGVTFFALTARRSLSLLLQEDAAGSSATFLLQEDATGQLFRHLSFCKSGTRQFHVPSRSPSIPVSRPARGQPALRSPIILQKRYASAASLHAHSPSFPLSFSVSPPANVPDRCQFTCNRRPTPFRSHSSCKTSPRMLSAFLQDDVADFGSRSSCNKSAALRSSCKGLRISNIPGTSPYPTAFLQ